MGTPVENASLTQGLLFCQTSESICKYFGSIHHAVVSVATVPGCPFQPGLSKFAHFAFSKVFCYVMLVHLKA